MIVVPEAFALATFTREGDAGRDWIDQLPDIVALLCTQWGLTLEGASMHGYLGLVLPARRGNDPCVLKVSWSDASTVEEAAALTAWNGQGAVRLLDAESAFGALLLEQLDHRRSLDALGIEEAIGIAGRLLRRLAIPAPDGLRSQWSVAGELTRNLPERWERCGRPMPRAVLDHARDLAAQHGAASGELMVNYDLHYADVLAGEREPWLAVDPKVVAGDPEFGIAQLLWRRLEDIKANGGLDRQFPVLVEAAQLDPTLARQWTLVRCVDYWLWALSVGLTHDPARCAAIIEWLM